MSARQCEICRGEEFDVIATKDRKGKPLETGMCQRCGLIRHMHIPTEEEELAFYEQEYRRDFYPSDKHFARAWRRAEQFFKSHAQYLEPDASVFEVGAGLGCTVKRFELGGFRAAGIEPDPNATEFARNVLHSDVRRGRVEDIEPEPVHDLVFMVHVIEHFRSPRDAVSRAARMLKPGGLLYLECPNVGAPFTNRARLFHRAHIHNFTPSSLTMLAEDCGFRVVKPHKGERHTVVTTLYRYTGERRLAIDERNGQRTLDAIARFDGGRFYLRPRYYWRRLRKLGHAINERFRARAVRRHVLALCARGRKPRRDHPGGAS